MDEFGKWKEDAAVDAEARDIAGQDRTDWMHLMIEVPADDGAALLLLLKEKLGFAEIDWCELQRPDFARVSYGPSEPRTSSGYEQTVVVGEAVLTRAQLGDARFNELKLHEEVEARIAAEQNVRAAESIPPGSEDDPGRRAG